MACQKQAYDKKGARTVVNHRTKGGSRRKRPEYLRAYQCECGFWHVTHKKPLRY